MRIGILGTGNVAVALGTVWTRAGHEVLIGGRSPERTARAAARIGDPARSVTPAAAVRERDAVLLAVAWQGLRDILHAAGAADGALAGVPLIDPSNAVEHGVGELRIAGGRAIAEQVADRAPGAHVVKAFHLVPAERWLNPPTDDLTVVLAGDDEDALRITGELVLAAGARPAVLGSLRRARQLEEVAGFAIGLAFAGVDPNSAVSTVTMPVGTG